MNIDFYESQNLIHPEEAVILERYHYTRKAKVYIPSLMPDLPSGGAINNSDRSISTSNVLNISNKHNISRCTSTNYIELDIPRHLQGYTDEYGYVSGGGRLLIVFIGGDINRPYIMGGL